MATRFNPELRNAFIRLVELFVKTEPNLDSEFNGLNAAWETLLASQGKLDLTISRVMDDPIDEVLHELDLIHSPLRALPKTLSKANRKKANPSRPTKPRK